MIQCPHSCALPKEALSKHEWLSRVLEQGGIRMSMSNKMWQHHNSHPDQIFSVVLVRHGLGVEEYTKASPWQMAGCPGVGTNWHPGYEGSAQGCSSCADKGTSYTNQH